jgi:allantoate deiminase
MTQYKFGTAAMGQLIELAAISDSPEHLTRLYLSKAYVKAIDTVSTWMRNAGMSVHVDPVGNVIGRYEGNSPHAVALLMGSHIDTVVNAGRYDGPLGVVAAISAVAELSRSQKRFPFAIEVVAFGDEEGVRFPTALVGSRAFAGTADPQILEAKDPDGISIRDALQQLNRNQPDLASAARKREHFLGYLEVHIEQGPVLESENLAVATVTAISGAGRYRLEVDGMAGHAGTVPMNLRHDALTAAAEIVLAIEAQAQAAIDIVATVGQLRVDPGAVNVIPGKVIFTLDIRGPDDAAREQATRQIIDRARAIAHRRGVHLTYERFHEAKAVRCDTELIRSLTKAVSHHGIRPRLLTSGAGHDAMAIADLCPVAMLFVRCAGGISHHPGESVGLHDIDCAIRVVLSFIEIINERSTIHVRDIRS